VFGYASGSGSDTSQASGDAVTDQLNGVIMKMLAKSPEERYQTTAQVADALKQVLANLPAPGRL
jgi:hypothetical protein